MADAIIPSFTPKSQAGRRRLRACELISAHTGIPCDYKTVKRHARRADGVQWSVELNGQRLTCCETVTHFVSEAIKHGLEIVGKNLRSTTRPNVEANEEWADIAGWPGYRVSQSGIVQTTNNRRRPREWVELCRKELPTGYLQVHLWRNRECRPVGVHTLVLEAFVGPRPDGMQACHNNGIRTDNSLENLRWGTPKENAEDRVVHGTDPVGERNGYSKLTDEIVRQMRSEVAAGGSREEIAARLGIHSGTVDRVCRGDSWKHIPMS